MSDLEERDTEGRDVGSAAGATAKPESTRALVARRGRRLARYLLGLIAAVLVVDAIVGEKGLLSLLKARRDYSAVEQALERARQENADLREEARRLREDPTAIEELARRELGLIKPGEKLFIVKEKK